MSKQTRREFIENSMLAAAVGAGSCLPSEAFAAEGSKSPNERLRVAVLVSRSGDGEVLARVARRTGFDVIRGSASRGGVFGLRQVRRAVRAQGMSVATVTDGPRGPVYKCKPGTLLMAKISGAPILPVAFAPDRCWRLGSWDRFIVPKPFARVVFAVGEPFDVAEGLSSDELQERALALEVRLNAEVARAEKGLEKARGS